VILDGNVVSVSISPAEEVSSNLSRYILRYSYISTVFALAQIGGYASVTVESAGGNECFNVDNQITTFVEGDPNNSVAVAFQAKAEGFFLLVSNLIKGGETPSCPHKIIT
jgi:hypothetical protein